MLEFNKSVVKNGSTKIVSNYNKPNDLNKINDIVNRMHPVNFKKEEKIVKEPDVKDLQRQISAIRNLKK